MRIMISKKIIGIRIGRMCVGFSFGKKLQKDEIWALLTEEKR